jgi:hypothetical protein
VIEAPAIEPDAAMDVFAEWVGDWRSVALFAEHWRIAGDVLYGVVFSQGQPDAEVVRIWVDAQRYGCAVTSPTSSPACAVLSVTADKTTLALTGADGTEERTWSYGAGRLSESRKTGRNLVANHVRIAPTEAPELVVADRGTTRPVAGHRGGVVMREPASSGISAFTEDVGYTLGAWTWSRSVRSPIRDAGTYVAVWDHDPQGTWSLRFEDGQALDVPARRN